MSQESTPPTSTAAEAEKTLPVDHVEHIATHDKVPGHDNYYEKDGLRTYGDGEDHDHEPPVGALLFNKVSAKLTRSIDDLQAHAFFDCHGIFVDWLTDSRLYLWLEHSKSLTPLNTSTNLDPGGIPPYI
jgi:hypothetical protein